MGTISTMMKSIASIAALASLSMAKKGKFRMPKLVVDYDYDQDADSTDTIDFLGLLMTTLPRSTSPRTNVPGIMKNARAGPLCKLLILSALSTSKNYTLESGATSCSSLPRKTLKITHRRHLISSLTA